jgi:hypothetical protein
MATKSTACAGCSRVFTLSGYAIHLHTTTNSQCHQIYQQQLAYVPESDAEPSADAHSISPMSSSHVTISQEDFVAADVAMEDEPMGYRWDDSVADWTDVMDPVNWQANEDISDDSDDEAVAEAAELELGWEPLPPVHSILISCSLRIRCASRNQGGATAIQLASAMK